MVNDKNFIVHGHLCIGTIIYHRTIQTAKFSKISSVPVIPVVKDLNVWEAKAQPPFC